MSRTTGSVSERGAPLIINYLLEDTALFGGVKVVLHHAELLRRSGHRVTVVSPAPPPTWYPTGDGFLRVESLAPELIPVADLQIATFWTTVGAALASPSGRAVHFCQGYEAALEHNRDDHPMIIEAYSNPLPTWTVSPHLAELNRDRFGRAVRIVPPALEPFWRPRRRPEPAARCRILVAHPFEFYMKGVDTALRAVALLRDRGLDLELVRLSQWPLSDAERSVAVPDEFHHHIRPVEVAELLAGCDLLLAPSWPSEGFGLTVLEAMACGLPVVASEIPSHRSFAGGAAELVRGGDPDAFADAAEAVLTDHRRWNLMRRNGIDIARRHTEEVVAATLDRAARWVDSGEWRGRS
jgi:glycosyltransferase involved in cell wall biosynthesis